MFIWATAYGVAILSRTSDCHWSNGIVHRVSRDVRQTQKRGCQENSAHSSTVFQENGNSCWVSTPENLVVQRGGDKRRGTIKGIEGRGEEDGDR